MGNAKEKIIEKIEEINALVNKFIDSDHATNDRISLFAGIPGAALFLYEYAQYKPGKTADYYEKIASIIEKAFDHIAQTPHALTSYCSGISGTIWLTEYMRKKGVVAMDDDYLSADMINYLSRESLLQTIAWNNCDMLHGGFGFWALLLECDHLPHKELLIKQQLEALNRIVIDTPAGRNWRINEAYFGKTEENNITVDPASSVNLGLAHGICSIVILLAKTRLCHYFEKETEENIHRAVKLIKSLKVAEPGGISLYPSSVLNGAPARSSRLAWCYGDFCVANAFWMAGQATNNEDYKKEALAIIDFADMEGRDDSETIEAALCHGSAGIAQIYRHFYRHTGNPRYLDASDKWIEVTLQMAIHDDGYAGYKAYRTPEYGGWKAEYGFLEGISGIGLALLSSLSGKSTDWEKVLQIC